MTSKENRPLLPESEPSAKLFGSVLAGVALARRRAARIRVAALGAVILFCLAALVVSVSYAIREFYVSGFADYVSLVFSDWSAAFSNWQEMAFSLGESLPSLAVLILASVSLVLLWSVRRIARDARTALMPLPSV